MGKLLAVSLLAPAAFAQPAVRPQLAELQATAEKKLADWDALAKGLEGKLARMLPCDARVRSSIEEVSRASEERISALLQYLKAADAQAAAEAQIVARAASGDTTVVDEIRNELAEAQQERAAIEGQLADLGESVKAVPALADARKALVAIDEMVKQRIAGIEPQATRRAALTAALNSLAEAYQARERAIQSEMAAVAAEALHWSEYYAARLSRAQTECSITNQGPASTTRPRKKKE